MTVNILKAAAKVGLPLAFAAFALPVFGMPVDFTTTGTFTCGITAVGCSTSNGGSTVTVTNDGQTLNMTAVGYANLNIIPGDTTEVAGNPADDVNVITFNTLSTNHPAPADGVNTAGITFTLNIDQTSPVTAPNTGTLGGTFSGFIDAKGSNTVISFASNQTSLTLGGGTVYSLDFLFGAQTQWTIPNPGIATTGVTTETATLTPSVTPEPAFMMLTGLGFAGLAFVAYRRKRTVEQI
jgi:hypothetical protein